MTSTYRARWVAARMSREAHVEAFGGSAQTQVQYCKERGINATTFGGWLRSARAATTITLMPSAAGLRDEKDEIEQSVPDVVKREGARANAPLTALAVRIGAAAHTVTTATKASLRTGEKSKTRNGHTSRSRVGDQQNAPMQLTKNRLDETTLPLAGPSRTPRAQTQPSFPARTYNALPPVCV